MCLLLIVRYFIVWKRFFFFLLENFHETPSSLKEMDFIPFVPVKSEKARFCQHFRLIFPISPILSLKWKTQDIYRMKLTRKNLREREEVLINKSNSVELMNLMI